MMRPIGNSLLNLGRLAGDFVQEMRDAAVSILDERRVSRMKAHLDWSETARRDARLRR
jgi:hypothetical protein